MNKPIHLTDGQLKAGKEYCEAQLNHNKDLEDEHRAHFERELEFILGLMEERIERVIRLL